MNELIKIINSEIDRTGFITFKRFMEFALYHEKYGYYTSGNVIIGKDGDYYTSPCVHSSFGEVISNFILKSFKTLNSSELSIIEFGAGKGYLALDILDSLKLNHPDTYERVNYKIVELNKSAISAGKYLLKDHINKIGWFDSIYDLTQNSVTGVILSNEYIDAFPFHRIKYKDNNFYEICITKGENNIYQELLVRIEDGELFNHIRQLDHNLENGQEFEFNPGVESWIRSVNLILNRGFVLTIDYGDLSSHLISSARMNGTYKCFYNHKLNDNPYINIGKQDITSDVNFTDLLESGIKNGFQTIKYTTQGQFLIDWGLIEIMYRYQGTTHDKDRLAIKNLIMPELMGRKFKVAVQSKNINEKALKDFYMQGRINLNLGLN